MGRGGPRRLAHNNKVRRIWADRVGAAKKASLPPLANPRARMDHYQFWHRSSFLIAIVNYSSTICSNSSLLITIQPKTLSSVTDFLPWRVHRSL